MPPKKSATVQKVSGESGPVLNESSDPVQTAVAIVDKKVRNLEKRKNKLLSLQESADQGEQLKRDQEEAIAKLGEVQLQLDLVKDLQRQFSSLSAEYEKSRKRQQKLAKQQARDTERDAQKRAVIYTLRVQDMLNSIGDADKENFRSGVNGAVKLTDEELCQVDELYKLLTPPRVDNPSYKSELDAAGECLILMMEQNSKEIMGSTYKQLHGLMQSIDECGYFDQQQEIYEQEEEEEEQEDDYKPAEDQVTPVLDHVPAENFDYSEEALLPVEDPIVRVPAEDQFMSVTRDSSIGPGNKPEQHCVVGAPSSIITQTNMMSYMPSAPSPQFPGLAASPIQHTSDEGFSFMHESEVDRTQGFQQPQATLNSAPMSTSQVTQAQQTISPPPSQDYSHCTSETIQAQEREMNIHSENGQTDAVLTEHTGVLGGVNQTDVATGQANPTVSSQIQEAIESLSSGSGSVYNQESYQRQPRTASSNRGWQQQGGSVAQSRRGGGGGWASQQKGVGMYRNGRSYQGSGRTGGYDGFQSGYQNTSKGFQGGYQGKSSSGGGRPNYRTNASGCGGGGQRR